MIRPLLMYIKRLLHPHFYHPSVLTACSLFGGVTICCIKPPTTYWVLKSTACRPPVLPPTKAAPGSGQVEASIPPPSSPASKAPPRSVSPGASKPALAKLDAAKISLHLNPLSAAGWQSVQSASQACMCHVLHHSISPHAIACGAMPHALPYGNVPCAHPCDLLKMIAHAMHLLHPSQPFPILMFLVPSGDVWRLLCAHIMTTAYGHGCDPL